MDKKKTVDERVREHYDFPQDMRLLCRQREDILDRWENVIIVNIADRKKEIVSKIDDWCECWFPVKLDASRYNFIFILKNEFFLGDSLDFDFEEAEL